jgi:hypothetical protein
MPDNLPQSAPIDAVPMLTGRTLPQNALSRGAFAVSRFEMYGDLHLDVRKGNRLR